MVIKGMKTPTVFAIVSENQEIKRYSLSKGMSDKYLEILLNKMETDKYYQDMEITMIKLSGLTGIPCRSLSEIINNRLGQNFFDFINTYRIKDAERLLADPNTQFKTVLEIMYEVGFNNKTSFNAFFKKRTGMTPTEYKKTYSVSLAYS